MEGRSVGYGRLSTAPTEPYTDSDAASERPDGDGILYARPKSQRIGVFGAVFLILNRMVGTGIFSTPSSIFAATGSVGISLLLWVVAGLLTLSGLSVYLEFGLAIPRSGGEKNYIERVFRRPRYFATSVFAVQIILLGFSASNSLAFGRYLLLAVGHPMPDGWVPRAIAITGMTSVVLLHATLPKWGVRLSNALGIFKVIVLLLIIFSGIGALAGYRLVPDPRNFENFWAIEKGDGYGGGGAYAYATALLQVVYSYKGWENANYVMGELKNPQRTLKIAAPLALSGVMILYALANVAYFAAIPKAELAKSEVIVAGIFFRNVFGESIAARSLPAFVALSNIGNVLAVSFASSRVNRELAKEGIVPWSKFWASTRPFGTPAASLFLHWIVTTVVLTAPPPGPAYNFIVSLSTYPGAWVNAFVTGGLIYLHYNKSENWASPWRTCLPVSITYLLLNLFLVITPLVPPSSGWNAGGYPYYAFPLAGIGILLLGAAYWVLWAKVWPRLGGYTVVAEKTINEDGEEVVSYIKIWDGGKARKDEACEALIGGGNRRRHGYDRINS
ncbi:High-affinity methionine permease [Madurella mycetomatis]|uniref:High-affinity methionine permease n=1 Tax=Madurella mycetomatis TaxID=100816 RepID=A0A175VXJ5_9PEZI|nr:High-affinity methionine permease [Madurella mycetomatis]